MVSTAMLLLLAAGAVGCAADDPGRGGRPVQASEELEALYRSGIEFTEFLAAADRRRELWVDHYENGAVPPEVLARASAIRGTWRILAIAEDWCSDSVNTIPFLALLAERVDGIELRVIDSDAGRGLMEAHRTPDGRAATPTVLILDSAYEVVGCWVERPSELQKWALASRPGMTDEAFLTRKMAWYRDDAGASTVGEMVDLIEAASGGRASCPTG